ncbi:Subtilisin-like protease [Glycine soja]|nr:Subtilisin-like protease [Glycine soja]
MSGYAAGIAKGVAPKARLAAYKVCWKNSGCFDSDILAAMDEAVSDGVQSVAVTVLPPHIIWTPSQSDPTAQFPEECSCPLPPATMVPAECQ